MKTTVKVTKLGAWSAAVLALLLAGPAVAAPPGDGTPEDCSNGVDDDGDRKVDCDDRECRDDPACADGGGDGNGNDDDGDCDDSDDDDGADGCGHDVGGDDGDDGDDDDGGDDDRADEVGDAVDDVACY